MLRRKGSVFDCDRTVVSDVEEWANRKRSTEKLLLATAAKNFNALRILPTRKPERGPPLPARRAPPRELLSGGPQYSARRRADPGTHGGSTGTTARRPERTPASS